MQMPEALLENWMREYYFTTSIDIGSSGVEDFTLIELRRLLNIEQEELDRVIFDDSPTLGSIGLRSAIARRWGGGAVERVMATHGSSEANFLITTALLRRGDEVVVLDPSYQQLYSVAESLGCLVRRWPLRFESGFVPDIEEGRRLITTRTRMVILNFPHNPTGATITADQQAQLIKAVEAVGAYLVWDAAFAELTYDTRPLSDPSLASDRIISTGTLSKAYGLPGLRVGWCLAAPHVLARLVRARDYITLHLSPLIELIAQHAITNADRLLTVRRATARANIEIVRLWVEQHRDFVSWVPPTGGVCAFPLLPRVSNVEQFCRRLAERCKVLLVPGSCFGQPAHVRLGFGKSTGTLTEGLSRLSGELCGKASALR